MTSNAALNARRQAVVPRAMASKFPVYAARAEGAEIWDVDGRRYIDFVGGIGAMNTGHRHPRVMAAIAEQLERFSHTCFQVLPYEGYVALAEKLCALAPMAGPARALLVSTGAEANENAIKIARAHTGRAGVIAFADGFHGRTLMTLGMSGKVAPNKVGFGPFPAEIFHLPFPSQFHGVTVEGSLAALGQLFKVSVDPARIAAIAVEPVQGDGGFRIAPPDFLQALRRVCDEHGILLIADEVQTGFARTGRMFAIEHAGVAPDLLVLAKSLGGGLPLGAVVGRAAVMDSVQPGGLGTTFGGNPLACAAALASIAVIESEGLCARAEAIGRRMRDVLGGLRHPRIGEVRGLGAMTAVELVADPASRKPAPALAAAVLTEALARGLILLTAGAGGNVIRTLVPLIAADALIDEGLAIFVEALAAADRPAVAAQ